VPEFAAATLGICPTIGVGLLRATPLSFGGAKDEAIDDCDILLAGLAGRAGVKDDGDAGNGAGWGVGVCLVGGAADVGVGVGVD
jgi:hypothetical protein